MTTASVRTCLGCGLKRSKQDLVRFILDSDGTLIQDDLARLAGRGAYCCKNKECIKLFFQGKKRLARAFRGRTVAGITRNKLLVSGSWE